MFIIVYNSVIQNVKDVQIYIICVKKKQDMFGMFLDIEEERR